MNKSDGQVESMGLDRATLDQINKKAILLNVQARRGENLKSESGMWPGYDPALQVCTPIFFNLRLLRLSEVKKVSNGLSSINFHNSGPHLA